MNEPPRAQIQHQETAARHFFPNRKWGFLFAGLYLLVSIPCAIAYLVGGHEYSIPMFIVYFASLPAYFVISRALRFFTLPLERLPCGEAIGLSILLALTAICYFLAGQGVGWAVRIWAHRKRSRQE